MSERFPHSPPPPAVSHAREAAVAILFRHGLSGVEVYWMKRDAALDFAGGFHAFPGGAVESSDANLPVQGASGPAAAFRAAAARELFEETGVLVAHGPEISAAELASYRKALLADQLTFRDFLSNAGLSLLQEDFRPAGRWITPEHSPKRFDAQFFLIEAHGSVRAEVWPGEASFGEWISPALALKKWEDGSVLLYPPHLHVLQCLAQFVTPEVLLPALAAPPLCPDNIPLRAEFQRGIRVLPLQTPTLPPATHTNCYILGNGELLVVDPGAAEIRQTARLLALLEGLKAEGKTTVAVLLTHHHQDHVGGAKAVTERLGVPLWCHARTAERLNVRADRLLDEGDVLSLDGAPPMHFRVLHTPGHARGHLCLLDEGSRAAVVGDMVAGLGTIVIDPPEGDMTDYVTQLARLRDLPVGALYPAHGPPIVDGPRKLDAYLLHRRMREKKVLQVLPAQGATLEELVALAYDDVPKDVHPIALRNTYAILLKLLREGRVSRNEDRYLPLSS